MHNVVVGAADGNNWRANPDASELNGYVEYRQVGSRRATARAYARLLGCRPGAAAAKEVETILADEQPTTCCRPWTWWWMTPSCAARGSATSRSTLVNRGGLAREWRLNKLNLTMPEAAFSATGNWIAVITGRGTAGAVGADERAHAHRDEVSLDVADSGSCSGGSA